MRWSKKQVIEILNAVQPCLSPVVSTDWLESYNLHTEVDPDEGDPEDWTGTKARIHCHPARLRIVGGSKDGEEFYPVVNVNWDQLHKTLFKLGDYAIIAEYYGGPIRVDGMIGKLKYTLHICPFTPADFDEAAPVEISYKELHGKRDYNGGDEGRLILRDNKGKKVLC
jgi:hypothetical protein